MPLTPRGRSWPPSGKLGKPGEQVRCLISVNMLSEGWDARNVTQILGLRAFQSQLLCEQVVGRGLRRSQMLDLTEPEFVDVYGVPFQLLPMAKATGGKPAKPPEYQNVHTVADRHHLRIQFPRLVQVVPDIQDKLDIDLDAIEPIRITPLFDPTDDLDRAGPRGPARRYGRRNPGPRRVPIRTSASSGSCSGSPPGWSHRIRSHGCSRRRSVSREQVIRPVSEGGKIDYAPGVDPREICNLRYLTVIRERLSAALRPGEGPERFLPALDEYQPIGSTDGLNFNSPKDKCVPADKSHLSHAVVDSGLERKICAVLDAADNNVEAWVKNHRLYLEIPYLYFGNTYRYRPDFVVRLTSGLMVLLEGKGEPSEKDDAKATAARRWVQAVNTWGGLGTWVHHICYDATTLNADLITLLDTVAEDSPAA